MDEYSFTVSLRLASPSENAEQHLDALLSGGCNDATIALGRPGYMHFDFDREALSAADAISSAISDVERLVKDARVVSVGPDLVNLTDLAELAGCTRQNMRRYASGEARVSEPFPAPVANGEPSLWHLAAVAPWVESNTPLQFKDPTVTEVAAVTFEINHSLQEASLARPTSGSVASLVETIMLRRLERHLPRRVTPLPNPMKIAEVVSRLVSEGVVKTKLNKLLFYIDFLHFKNFEASVTGLSYKRFELGPVPEDYDHVFLSLKEAGIVSITEEKRGNYVAEVIRRATEDEYHQLSTEELTTIDTVKKRFGNTNAVEIVDISHTEPAWLETAPFELIDYAFSKRLVALTRIRGQMRQ